MAFASVGSRGTNTLKVAGQTLTVSPTASISAGALLAVFVAWDNNNDTTPDGPLSRQMSCEDDAGNIYVTIYGGQRIGVSSGVSLGAMGFIFIAKIRTALTTSSVITLRHFQPPPNAKPAKAVSLWEFSMGEGMIFAVERAHSPGQVQGAGDPAAISLTSLTSREWLFLHVLASEGPSTDAFTWDSDYTQITKAGTTGGADDSNMTVIGGFRIATLTGDTVDVSSDTADRDHVQGLAAICEVPEVTNFPRTPILDDFNRADEIPLDNGTWDAVGFTGQSTTHRLQLLSNRAARSSALGTDSAGQWWLTPNKQGSTCAEVYVSVPVAVTADVDSGSAVICRGRGQAGDLNVAGYSLNWVKANPAAGRNTAHDWMQLATLSSSGGTGTAYVYAHPPLRDGARYGVREDGDLLHMMLDLQATYETVAATYASYADLAAARATYDAMLLGDGFFEVTAVYLAGSILNVTFQKLGLQALGGSIRLDDFGGGEWCGFIPQIYRRVHN
jgi:hypothetical protein